VIPLCIHRGNKVVSGEAWRLYKEVYPRRKFSDFWLECCQDFSMRNFQLIWFFLQRDGHALATEASSPQTFVKTEPLAPRLMTTTSLMLAILRKTVVATRATLSNFLSEILALWKLCNLSLLKFLNGIRQ
jgi:hypothetical protein